jgi:hypothetical protein
LGGGERPNPPTINRVPVGIDNTDPDVTEGDFAVPTMFNGNFNLNQKEFDVNWEDYVYSIDLKIF